MAYDFNGTNQYLSTSSAPAQANSTTIACWYRVSNASIRQALVSLSDAVGNLNRHLLYHESSARVSIATGGALESNSAVVVPSNTWTHGAGVWNASNSRYVYANGTQSVNFTSNVSVSTFDRVEIGRRPSTLYLAGNIAEVGIWNAALTAAEVASLAKGMTCDKIRPQNLVFYAPLVRDLNDQKGGLAITNNNGATVANHPRVYA